MSLPDVTSTFPNVPVVGEAAGAGALLGVDGGVPAGAGVGVSVAVSGGATFVGGADEVVGEGVGVGVAMVVVVVAVAVLVAGAAAVWGAGCAPVPVVLDGEMISGVI